MQMEASVFQKILVALDSTQGSDHVFQEALSLAKNDQSKMLLLHVLSGEESSSPNIPLSPILDYYPQASSKATENYQKQWRIFEEKCLHQLNTYREEAAAVGVNSEVRQQLGSPGFTVCEVAQTWEADLIVIGSRGHSLLRQLVLGSVSNYVLHHSPCSVLVVYAQRESDSQKAE
jgi:nucleotide-binding universal stress UspA family protein